MTDNRVSSEREGPAAARSYVRRYAVAAAGAAVVCGIGTGLLWVFGPLSLAVVVGAATLICLGATMWLSYDLRDPPRSSPNIGPGGGPGQQPYPEDPREHQADKDMAEAEFAVSQGGGTELQRRRVRMMRRAPTHEERRHTWLLGEAGRRHRSS